MIGYQCVTTVLHRYVEYCVEFVSPVWKNPQGKKTQRAHEKGQRTRKLEKVQGKVTRVLQSMEQLYCGS